MGTVETIAIAAAVGLIIGWLVTQIAGSEGMIGNILVGIAGALAGSYLVPMIELEVPIADPVIASIVIASIGAGVAMLLARLLTRA